jgi:hypothetical protein
VFLFLLLGNLYEDVQDARLGRGRELRDLVQKKRRVRRHAEFAQPGLIARLTLRPLAAGAAKRAPRWQRGFVERRAVHAIDPARAMTRRMYQADDQLLAGAGLAADQHRRIHLARARRGAHNREHRRIGGQQQRIYSKGARNYVARSRQKPRKLEFDKVGRVRPLSVSEFDPYRAHIAGLARMSAGGLDP